MKQVIGATFPLIGLAAGVVLLLGSFGRDGTSA